ncbi:MAG: ROK family protein [Paracoccaceae bacterium]|nr:ROK family protein [Paracoccaceae bacterium]
MEVVVQLETETVDLACIRSEAGKPKILFETQFAPDLSDPTGKALFRGVDVEVSKAVSKIAPGMDVHNVNVSFVMPGSLRPPDTVVRVSRLNIRQECNVTSCLSEHSARYTLVNDVLASAMGHIGYSLDQELTQDWESKVILFIYVNEGIGSLIVANSAPISGAGFAGPLGHAIVEPKGQYFDDFRARGALETYSSRPWISANIVNRFFTERHKSQEEDLDISNSSLRRALEEITLDKKYSLSIDLINVGVDTKDNLALSALHDATDYLGLAISHIIVALNPHLVVLDGGVIHNVQGYFEHTVHAIKKYTYVDGWNSTTIVRSQNSPNNTIYGAIDARKL